MNYFTYSCNKTNSYKVQEINVFRCNDGTEFRIHRAILSVASPYFRAYFTNSIRRDEPEPTEAFVNATGAIFKLILDYAYSGSCEVKPDNVEALLVCADQYEVLGVLKFCCQYILGK